MKIISVHTEKPYQIQVGAGILPTLGDAVASLPGKRYTKALIVTDDKVNGLYGDIAAASLEKAGLETAIFAFPNGELSKNMDTVNDILSFFCDHYLTRSDVVIALGGGVTGDMAGFAAAIYQRGVDYIQVPTTLLAAIDSSVGGKTAVNIPQGKNMVGAFWQPELVLCDIDTLSTLSQEDVANGMAEALKHGCIWDADYFTLLEQGDVFANLSEIISRSVEIKAHVVSEDEREHGLRQILNFGHTLGHGVEKLSVFQLSHGKAVAIGMCLMADACAAQGRIAPEEAARIRTALKRLGLPTVCPYPLEEVCAASQGDKKRQGDQINLIALDRIGKAAIQPVKASLLQAFFTCK